MNKERIFYNILKNIKEVKIQGARNIARKALYAYFLIPTEKSKRLLLSSRPTEPMLARALKEMKKKTYKEILEHFDSAQDIINKNTLELIKNGDRVFTHCHSTNVSKALIYAKRKGKKFEVYNTETRPLMQGRKTSKELANAGIKVTQFIDSAAAIAIEKENSKDKVYATKVFIGADALLNNGIINKVGSEMISELAFIHKIPVYIIADSWKYSSEKIPIEKRKIDEVWDKAPKKIKILNPAFEFVPKRYITKIVSDLGTLKYEAFVKKVK
jgi:translation initiation factor 2B subunit (eIF-2B alpha/beta/delta family)